MDNLITAFQNQADVLRNSAQLDKSNDVFSTKQFSVTSNNSISGNAYVGIAATNSASIGTYQISDINLATAASQSAQNFNSNNTSVTSNTPTNGMFNPGIFQINNTDITINPNDSLLNIQSSINFASNQTGVSANIIQISSNNFQFTFQSVLPGADNSYSINDSNNCLSNINWNNIDANDAIFNFNNIAMTRSTNTVTDILSGVTFNFYQNTPTGTVITAVIESNPVAASAAIDNFVQAYNDIKNFIANQNQRDPITSKFTEDAILGGDNIVLNIGKNIENEMMRVVSGITSTPSNIHPINLSELGIKFYDLPPSEANLAVSNLLEIDSLQLATMLSTKFNDVRNVFGLSTMSSNNNFLITQTSTDLNINSFSLNLDTTQPSGKQARITYIDPSSSNSVTIDVCYTENTNSSTGGVIDIKAGQSIISGTTNNISTPLDGLSIVYVGSASNTSSNFTITQGIADRIYNLSNDILDSNKGPTAIAIDNLKSDISDKNDKITKLTVQVNQAKDKILKQFAEVEKAIGKANSILTMLEANDNAKRDK